MSTPILHLGFAGTPELAATVLKNLLNLNVHKIEIVYTQPDRPAGRGRKIQTSPVKQLALLQGLNVAQPATTTAIDPGNRLTGLDVLIVVAYGMLLPADILNRPRLGCINIHTSLLPRWRGAAPIQRAILAGDRETGVTIMQIDAGLDTGPILAQARCSIRPEETSGSLHDKLAALGAECLLETLEKLATSSITPVTQDDSQATYASKISKAEARLDWNHTAIELERQIRAFNPAPVAYAEFHGETLRVWEAGVIHADKSATPGTVLAYGKNGVDIATGNGILRLLKIQPAGKRVMTVAEFLTGRPDYFNP